MNFSTLQKMDIKESKEMLVICRRQMRNQGKLISSLDENSEDLNIEREIYFNTKYLEEKVSRHMRYLMRCKRTKRKIHTGF